MTYDTSAQVRPGSRGAVGAGLVALRGWRIALVLWVSATLAALAVPLSMYSVFNSVFSATAAGDAMLQGKLPDAGLYRADLMHQYHLFTFAGPAVTLSLILTVALQVFLAGGLVEFAGREPRPFFGSFFGACGRHLRYNATLCGLFVLSVVVVVGIWLAISFGAASAIFRSAPPNAPGKQALIVAAVVVAVLLYALLSVGYDLARARRRLHPSSAVGEGWVAGILGALRHPARVAGLFLFWLVLGGAAAAAAVWLEGRVDGASWGAIVAAAAIGQIAVAARCFARLGMWGSVVALAESIEPTQRVLENREAWPDSQELLPLPPAGTGEEEQTVRELAALDAPPEG